MVYYTANKKVFTIDHAPPESANPSASSKKAGDRSETEFAKKIIKKVENQQKKYSSSPSIFFVICFHRRVARMHVRGNKLKQRV